MTFLAFEEPMKFSLQWIITFKKKKYSQDPHIPRFCCFVLFFFQNKGESLKVPIKMEIKGKWFFSLLYSVNLWKHKWSLQNYYIITVLHTAFFIFLPPQEKPWHSRIIKLFLLFMNFLRSKKWYSLTNVSSLKKVNSEINFGIWMNE